MIAGTWKWPLARARAQEPIVVGEMVGSKRRHVELGYPANVTDPVPVRAARDGDVIAAIRLPTGFAVCVGHDDGWTTHYAHLSAMFVSACLPNRRPRRRVRADEVIGLAAISPAHICFEIWRWDGARYTAVDPVPLLDQFTRRS